MASQLVQHVQHSFSALYHKAPLAHWTVCLRRLEYWRTGQKQREENKEERKKKEREDREKEKSVLSVQTVYLTVGEYGAWGGVQDHAQICFGLGAEGRRGKRGDRLSD